TDDDSMFMFTNGQIVRMQACLDGDRSTIGHTKSGPTLVIADVHPTVAASDVPTLAANDIHPTAVTADVHPTMAAADVPTLAANDIHPTAAVADIHPTIVTVDVHPTLVIRDIGPLPTVASLDVAGPGGPGPIGDPQPFGGGVGR